ncbi:MAG: TraR/DksA C4-type zinc finger protein [Elusimicrobiota bacterium]|jgi:DnaK suppressor protein|nr:TraR/DksA C4-type zinc finger protein [Elusimicrobiota bacterium]
MKKIKAKKPAPKTKAKAAAVKTKKAPAKAKTAPKLKVEKRPLLPKPKAHNVHTPVKKAAACAREDALTPAEVKEIEKTLRQMREETLNRIKTKKETEMPEAEVGDDADLASQSLDKEVLFELNGNAQERLDQIEAALRRIAKGIYGTCEYCRCHIPKKRILALPFARYCINCQTSNEK